MHKHKPSWSAYAEDDYAPENPATQEDYYKEELAEDDQCHREGASDGSYKPGSATAANDLARLKLLNYFETREKSRITAEELQECRCKVSNLIRIRRMQAVAATAFPQDGETRVFCKEIQTLWTIMPEEEILKLFLTNTAKQVQAIIGRKNPTFEDWLEVLRPPVEDLYGHSIVYINLSKNCNGQHIYGGSGSYSWGGASRLSTYG